MTRRRNLKESKMQKLLPDAPSAMCLCTQIITPLLPLTLIESHFTSLNHFLEGLYNALSAYYIAFEGSSIAFTAYTITPSNVVIITLNC